MPVPPVCPVTLEELLAAAGLMARIVTTTFFLVVGFIAPLGRVQRRTIDGRRGRGGRRDRR